MPIMLERRSPSTFRRAPQGGFVAGESWIYFAFDLRLFGYAIWGRPAADDVRALVRLLETELERPPHDALVDLSSVEAISNEAFDALAAYTVKHVARLTRIVGRAAVVRPSGVNGAIVSGFFEVASRPFPVSFWDHIEPALAALGRSDSRACAAAVEAARAEVSAEPALLFSLRSLLAAHVREASLAGAARQLAISQRTLQRRLADHGTSFEKELQRVRLRAAERKLAETNEPITTLALDLGFATAQHFSTLFRKHTGQTPTAFRATRAAPSS